ncbi:LPXTG cell wall anchor domain-containing protein [Kitasatospora sp. CB02891]|uniref:DUF7927 domain-containing protein n=1 Tax=Kitasatospora sp. CB02891 TaxID=2020329 RepID=UPI000C270358|nr:LPXTG cell wall anchor domain-containing protein [Kitasatospora sp. CB02891]PJN23915.1 hypothetical protein CG736_21325 [Kitasatospora sp. CB02891]
MSTDTAAPGDRVTYSVTVHNTGGADFTDANPASFTDDLADVLNNAAHNNDATDGATVSSTTLTWSGPLAAGASVTVTVTVSVTVHEDAADGARLQNLATPGEPGTCAGSCATGTTISSIPPSPSPSPSPKPEPTKPGHEHERLPATGSDLAVPAAAGAGVLLLLGGGLIRWRRKVQRH